ncbi:MAG: alpha-galactosidase, partial [Ruminococcaceae bacterium]|nr:alpha-galactosidase [Oscillospiraceae bacterium]
FPFAAVEDYQAGVTWALQFAWPGSWQIELRRKDAGLAIMTGLPDEDYGHWAKIIHPGESFHTPEAYFTVGVGGVDAVSQRLQDLHRENWVGRDRDLPVLFNEYCTTWGNPTHDNIVKIVDRLRGRPYDYFVIDCGWYGREGINWTDCGGDWIPNDAEMFPEGLKATMDYIHGAGFKPGLWFEAETCSRYSRMFQNEDLLLKRHGVPIDTANRRFLDLRKEETHAYLEERVIDLMERCGIDYIKVDYNDTIGMGCDGAESLGEGLRQNGEGTLRFFRRMRERIPHLCIENCSSGGHRLEPAMMSVSDMASFSDAHECVEIPIIAAALHRLILPGQSQIWAVMQAKDSIRRINYSLINTFLGVMCISGDVLGLNDEQWAKVDEGVDFYREVRGVIRDGFTTFYGEMSKSWRHPEGWQALCRETEDGKTLMVIHTFAGKYPEKITLPVNASRILRTMDSEQNAITLENGQLTVELKADFEAIAVYLEK